MGQDFQLVAPRAQKTLSIGYRISGGKLGEDFWDGSYSRPLVYLLAIPILPQGQAVKTTLSSPAQALNDSSDVQGTTVDAIDNIRSAFIPGKRKADGRMPVAATISKQVKTGGEQPKTSKEGHSASAAVHRKTTTTFSDFPGEIHRLIFAQIEYLVDVINLGATSQYYWTFARECLDQYAISFIGQWAGENIVCVGDYVKPDDYPPGMFTAEERDEFRQWVGPADIDDDSEDDDSDRPFTLYDFGHPSFYDSENSTTPLHNAFFRLIGELRQQYPWETTLPRIVQSYLRERSRSNDQYLPEDQQWILRNLTTKQFVRAEAIALKPEFIEGPFIRGLGFAEVVLSRICWSSSDSVGMADPTNITRGVWAGHCFDITTRTKHEDETKCGQGWEDASDEVAAELADIWESNAGSNWREKVCESA